MNSTAQFVPDKLTPATASVFAMHGGLWTGKLYLFTTHGRKKTA